MESTIELIEKLKKERRGNEKSIKEKYKQISRHERAIQRMEEINEDLNEQIYWLFKCAKDKQENTKK